MKMMMTAETRAGLHKDSVECIEIYRKKINKIVELWNNVPNSLDNLLNIELFISMKLCDLFVLIKQYTQADQRWEEICIAGQIYTKMNESLKKLVGFKEEGNNNSYWVKVMGEYVQNDPKLYAEYINIKKELIEYAQDKTIQNYIKSIRNTDVHGDENLDSFTLFKILKEIDIDYTFRLFIEWGKLLRRTSFFVSDCCQKEIEKLK